jgi:hypothetical protein
MIAASAADTAAKVTVGSNGQALTANSSATPGVDWQYPPGYELAYAEYTSNVTVSGASEGAATSVVAAGSFTADGSSAYIVEFYAPTISPGASTGVVVILLEGSTVLGNIAFTSSQGDCLVRRKVTPASGSRTYSVKAWKAGSNDGTIEAGSGGTGAYLPGYIRVTKA